MLARRAFPLFLAPSLVVACQAFLSFETQDAAPPDASLPDAESGAPLDAPSTSDAGIDGAGCVTSRGAAMVPVAFLNRTPFCIDSNEATRAHYEAFLNDGGREGVWPTAPEGCRALKSSHDLPDSACAQTQPEKDPRYFPVACVDWCDAFAFCAWAGKRLCRVDEWQGACSRGDAQAYPYGTEFEAGRCNVGPSGGLVPVDTKNCPGATDGLYDMLGNVDEWVDSCDSESALSNCKALGGDWGSWSIADAEAVTCGLTERNSRVGNPNYAFGFRCCKDM